MSGNATNANAPSGGTPKLDTIYKKKDSQLPGVIPSNSEPQIHIREFSLEEQSKIEPLLQKKLHHSLISHRPGPGGSKAAYLEGNVVINLANSILGFNGWSFQIKELKIEHKERTSNGEYYVVSSCLVRVVLKDGTFREDIGFGDIKNKLVGPAIENSKKGAITDGLKRALRLFGNSLGNCLYDKDFINKNPKQNELESETLIKKSDTYPELINSRVPTNTHNSPGGAYIKPEIPEQYFDDIGRYLETGTIKKRPLAQVYPGSDLTPNSAAKKANTSSPMNAKQQLPSRNLASTIKKEAGRDDGDFNPQLDPEQKKQKTYLFPAKNENENENDAEQKNQKPYLFSAKNENDDDDAENFTDDSLDIEDLDREIAENELRRERVIREEQRRREEEEHVRFLEKNKPLEQLPANLAEEKLLFKSAASLKNISDGTSSKDLVGDLSEIVKAKDFCVKDEQTASSGKPFLLNVNRSMKISTEKFEKVGYFRDPKNRKYVESSHRTGGGS